MHFAYKMTEKESVINIKWGAKTVGYLKKEQYPKKNLILVSKPLEIKAVFKPSLLIVLLKYRESPLAIFYLHFINFDL